MSKEALKKAIRICANGGDERGGQTELATRLSKIMDKPVSQQRVWNWLNRDRRVPGEAAIPIEQAVNGEVSRHDLRPDLYPREAAA